jgi:hypothetical protein
MEKYKATVNELEIKIKNEQKENIKLKSYIQNLKDSYLNLESDYSNLKTKYYLILSKEEELQEYKILINNKNNEILQLKETIQNLKNKYKKFKNDLNLQYEKDVNQIRYFNEANLNKIESASKLEKLNELMYNKILQLENIIKNYEEEENKRIKEKEVQFEKKLYETKKKMLDYINEGRYKNKSNSTNKNLKEKLNFFHNKELMNELEYQSFQIEDLLIQRDHLDKIIREYQTDINIHNQIEKKLVRKNKKYTDIIKVLSLNTDWKYPINFNNKEKSRHNKRTNSSTDIINRIDQVNKTNSFYLTKSVSSQKELLYLKKELDNYKNKYFTLKDRLNGIYEKFSNFIKNLDEILETIYKENKVFNIQQVYNIDEFKKCDFKKLEPEQKYSIIICLIQNILPILNSNIITDNNENKLNVYKNENFILSSHNMKTFYKNLTLKGNKSFKEFDKFCSKFCNLTTKYTNNSNFIEMKKTFIKEKIPSIKKSYSLLKL